METFNDIISGDKPVLVDFFATWCAPCKSLAPVIESVGKEMQDEIRTLKVDIDKNEAAANKYHIQTVPTLILFRKGEILWQHSGYLDPASLKAQIKNHV